jgi:cell division protein ZapE
LYEDVAGLERLESSLIRLLARRRTVPGLYLWGGVGRGKSFLMDSFFNCAPVARKRRIHFHRFMQEIHKALNRHQGEADPMRIIARELARETRLLCLDEFHVTDITDAMLLGRLLRGLLDLGVVLVTTSNEVPDNLYRGGLQRERFLPAIALLKERLEVVELAGDTDYRLRALTQAATYYVPVDDASAQALLERFGALTQGAACTAGTLEVEGRALAVRAQTDGVVWFDFEALCGGPRSSLDYIEIGRCFHTVLLSGVPVMGEDDNDAARRFVNLLDELYDRRVKLLLSANAEPAGLYRGTRLAASFKRTVSRLSEMATHEYLASPHLSR